MVLLSRSKAVLELGKRLVAQLDDKGDLLAAWMAHMVAERMHIAETAPPESKASAEEACAKAILELWRHHEALPQRLRPFRELEPVLRTLQSLDVEHGGYRYYPNALQAAEVAEAPDEVRQWLDLIIGVDYTARLLIQFALQSAAQAAADEAAPWIELAQAAGAEELPERLIVEFVIGKDEEEKVDLNLQSLKEKLSRLDNFIKVAEGIADNIRNRLPKTGKDEVI